MRVIALVENSRLKEREDLRAEHGLSLYIEHKGGDLLFDTGASDIFGYNAERSGIDLLKADIAVISHHHYDHGGGLTHFLKVNQKARVYLRKCSDHSHTFKFMGLVNRYIGLDTDLIRKHSDRFEFVEGFKEIAPDLFILTDILRKWPLAKGNRRLFIHRDGGFTQDTFDHELILVIKEEGELVVFTGCSHNGILNMLDTVREAFPEYGIKAVFGGFHLVGLPQFNTMGESRGDVEKLGKELLTYNINKIYTGHCTGEKAFKLLKKIMADNLEDFPTGSSVIL